MAVDETDAYEFMALGECMVVLRNPRVWNAKNYVANRDDLICRLKERGFHSTLATAQKLAQYSVREVPGGTISPHDTTTLEAISQTVYSALSHETKLATVIVTNHSPPAALIDLPLRLGKPLTATQQALQSDLQTCLRAQLARPSIIMAWALGYDLVRSWIYEDATRLAAFNQQLAKNPRKGEPGAIIDYKHFFDVGEWRFLEICNDSQDATLKDFDHKVTRQLQNLLDQRNEFAHANDSVATPTEATAYVERMVRLVTGPPFV